MTPVWEKAFAELDALYAELPDLPCIACGKCCTNPSMTFAEFGQYAKFLLERFPRDEQIKALSQPEARSEFVTGNWTCRMQGPDLKCRCYAARCLSCRLEGYPLVDILAGRTQPLCPEIKPEHAYTQADIDQLDGWIGRTYDITSAFHEVAAEPYYLRMLNLDCWWAAMLDPRVKQPFFLDLRKRLAELVDVSPLAPHYKDTTRFAAKLELIDRFWQENESQQARAALKTMGRVIRDFPRTETYFTAEGHQLYNFMKKVIETLESGDPAGGKK